MNLTEQVKTCVADAGVMVNDYDQRSAMGMARSWLDNQKPIAWKPDQIEYPKRDHLAKDLVVMLEGHDREDQITALLEARKMVNEPFSDPSMAGYRAARDKRGQLLTPGEKKKARSAKEC